jgi:uncharacterized membrane protein
LHWLDRRRDVSLLLLGASLAFKHFAALLLPAYAIWIWRTSHDRQRSLARAAALAGLAPLLVSLPVLLWGPEGLVRSVLFSLTRDPDSFGRIQSIDAVLGLSGPAARLPLATMLLFVSVLTATGRIGRYTTALLTMTVLVDFNSVLFAQYIAWVVPFVPLSICDGRPERVPAAPGSG